MLSIMGCGLISGPVRASDNQQSRCEYYPIPIAGGVWISDMVIDSGGLAWVMTTAGVYYFAGDGFREPVSGPLKGSEGPRVEQLHGGPDRGAYVTQRGREEHEAFIYRLEDGAAKLVTTCYYEATYDPVGFYVSKSGDLFNWGQRFLARFNGKSWDRIEARLSVERTAVFDTGKNVYFYYKDSLYCGEKSGGLREAKCPKWVKVGPGLKRISSALWGGNRALLVNVREPDLFAFDLETGEEIKLLAGGEKYPAKWFYDAFSLRSGEVWIYGHTEEGRRFFRLSVDGVISAIPETEQLNWRDERGRQFPDSVLESSEGELIFGTVEDGLTLVRDGEFINWGWEHGLAGGTRHLHEDLDGNIWFPMNNRIVKLSLAQNPPTSPPETMDWDEVPLARSDIWELEPGQLAMFRKDMPGKLSRWDGKEWEHQEVPFEIDKVWASVWDDRGHLFLAMSSSRYGCYDIGPDLITEFKNIDNTLVDAVKNGVRDFKCDKTYQGIVVTPDDRLWFGYSNGDDVHMHDGARWDSFRVSADMDGIFRSSRYGVIMGTRGRYRRYYCYDKGQIIEIDNPEAKRRYSMTDGELFQLYERELVDEHPDKYFMIMQEGEKTWVFFNPDDFEELMDGYGVREDYDNLKLPNYFKRLSPASSGGAWIFSSSGPSGAGRLFGNRIVDLTVEGTPLGGKRINDIKEDAGGDLWFLAGREQPGLAYRYSLSSLKLDAGATPKNCGRTLECSVAVTPRHMAGGITFVSRLNEGEWTIHEDSKGPITIRFPKSGEYHCEISGIKMAGKIKNSASFDVVAEVALPETVVNVSQREPVFVDSIKWIPPVSIRKSRDDVSAALLWRTGGSIWREVADDGLMMVGMEPGEYVIEFAAEEEGIWRDQSPASIKIRFEPDFEKLIHFYISELFSEDNDRKLNARKMLIELGDKGAPIMKKKLLEAERSRTLINELRQILNTLSREQ